MKHIKHLFFLSLVCSIVLFIACDEETGLGGDYDEEISDLKNEIDQLAATRSRIGQTDI